MVPCCGKFALHSVNENESDAIIKLENQRSDIKWTSYLATGYAEGFEGEGSTAEEQLEAWACLIKTGAAWSLQGWFGRNAHLLIKQGLIDKTGKINWDLFDEKRDGQGED